MRFDHHAFFIFLGVLIIEVVIGSFFRDRFVRHFVGDVFIVVLIAYGVRSLFPIKLETVVLGTWIFALFVEITQYFDLIGILGWRSSPWAHLTIGSTFDGLDLLAYTIGSGISLTLGRSRTSK